MMSQALIKLDPRTTRAMLIPPSLPFRDGSLGDQAIPACSNMLLSYTLKFNNVM
ncbi:hypothetical protein PILCRDRAFT_827592, partial [Piloderma croceum F 1598]